MNKEQVLKSLNETSKNTLMETLKIIYTSFTEDTLTAEMHVTPAVYQPMGFLHGGVSLALAETVGSVLSSTSVDKEQYYVFGTQVNGYHLKPVKSGILRATASFLNKGNTSQVIEINLYNENNGEVFKNCYVTMTNRIVPKKRF